MHLKGTQRVENVVTNSARNRFMNPKDTQRVENIITNSARTISTDPKSFLDMKEEIEHLKELVQRSKMNVSEQPVQYQVPHYPQLVNQRITPPIVQQPLMYPMMNPHPMMLMNNFRINQQPLMV